MERKRKNNPQRYYEEELKQYNKTIFMASVFVAIGIVFYHYVEKLTWLDSAYYTVITLATVGYGDITPKTSAGKLFTIFYVMIGITIFISLANTIIKKRLQIRELRKETKDDN